MKSKQIEAALTDLFEDWAGSSPDLILPLAPSGSDRVYFRLQGGEHAAIGTYSPNDYETKAFLSFSKHFKNLHLPVPEIYAQNAQNKVYLQEDLGATTLYSYLFQKGDYFPDYLVQIYKKVVAQIARMQIIGGKDLDYSVCFPKSSFDKQSMFWDFNYFKYHFILPTGVNFQEEALEKDFNTLANFLLKADDQFFMFRDFQSRNIMIKTGEPYFIDYQGGRRGALQYDLASLLYQAKANIPDDIRNELLEHYLNIAGTLTKIDRDTFIQYYYGFVLIRCIQVLGAYGFRGLYQRKSHFLESIPFALRNVKWLFENVAWPIEMPEIKRLFQVIVDSKTYEPFDKIKGSSSLLTVSVNSFSYKRGGLPADDSGNGGGFVFDCRFLHNPGRYEPYKKLTGRDESVINFLRQHSKMESFLNDIYRIVDNAVEDYIDRSFTHLMINFGCTGGQHRSVYAADQIAKHLKEKYGLQIQLHHIEQERKKWEN